MRARRPPAEVVMIGDRRLAQQPPAGLDTTIAALGDCDIEQLRLQWRNHFGGTAPSHLPRGLLLRMLVYRVQAAAFGDLDKGILRLLRQSKDEGGAVSGARPFETRGPTTREGVGLKSGALLVREWNGRLERVMILDKGFAWNGATYGSLSQIAKAMTGTSWNGHRFFGLRRSGAQGNGSRRDSSHGGPAGDPAEADLSTDERVDRVKQRVVVKPRKPRPGEDSVGGPAMGGEGSRRRNTTRVAQ
jgi:hypothetical protein